jgi:hypothetical protein
MAGTLPPGGGSSMPPSNQVKKVAPNGANIYRKPNTPATVTGNVKQAGRPSSLPPGSPKKLPATGPGSTPPTTK